MISDHDIYFYSIGIIFGAPVLLVILYSIFKSFGIEHSLLLSIVATPLLIWLLAWIWSLIDDVSGHLD